MGNPIGDANQEFYKDLNEVNIPFRMPTESSSRKVPTELGFGICQENFGLSSFLSESFMLCRMICMSELI